MKMRKILVGKFFALGAAALLALFGYLKDHKVKRWQGIVMLALFAVYYVYLFAF